MMAAVGYLLSINAAMSTNQMVLQFKLSHHCEFFGKLKQWSKYPSWHCDSRKGAWSDQERIKDFAQIACTENDYEFKATLRAQH